MEHKPSAIERTSMFWASNDESWHTSETICAVLELSLNTLMNWRVSGKGPVFSKSGKMIFYRKKEVIQWLNSFQPSNAQAA